LRCSTCDRHEAHFVGYRRSAIAASFGVHRWLRGTHTRSREEEAMKADALIRFMLLGNRSWEEFAILLVV
jgi:hypothetical protein